MQIDPGEILWQHVGMLTEGLFAGHTHSLLAGFDHHRRRHYPLETVQRSKRTIRVSQEIEEAAKQRGLSLSDYISQLHNTQRSVRVAYVASIYRGFALFEMARLPVEPAYTELVEGVLGPEQGAEFTRGIKTGKSDALPVSSARLLGADTRSAAVEAVLLGAQRAGVLHEGFIESARLLEATYFR